MALVGYNKPGPLLALAYFKIWQSDCRVHVKNNFYIIFKDFKGFTFLGSGSLVLIHFSLV